MKELMTATAAIVLCASLLPDSLASDDDGVQFQASGERAVEYVTFLAADELHGRQSCTPGYRKAADWAAANFERWGLAPAGEDGTYFQDVTVGSFDVRTGVPTLSVGEREFLLEDDDFSVNRISTAGTMVGAEVVFVGYGISATDKGLDEYASLNVEGKVVLALKGSPHEPPATRMPFSFTTVEEPVVPEEDPWEEEAKDATKIQVACDKGAAALLLYEPDASEEDAARRYWASRSGGSQLELERDFLCFHIEERVFRAIMKADAQESPGGTRKRLALMCAAIKAKEAQSAATGVQVALSGYEAITKYSAEQGNNVARNVIAKIPGTDPELKDQYVIAGGHLDHVGTRDGYIRNGADDNASGSACTLEVARVLSEGGFKPKRTLIFCLWAGEEMGLYGSNHYGEHPCDGVSMDGTVAYFNADMVGLGDTIGAPGALNFPSIWEVIQKNQDPEILGVVQPSTGGPGGSDHSAFIVRGIESLALMTRGGGGHPYYHQPEDDAQAIEPDILGKTAQFVVQGMMNLANETETELLIENREQLYTALRVNITNFNPALEDSSWEVITIEEQSRAELRERTKAETVAILRGEDSSPRPRRSIRRGLASLRVFEGDVELLEFAAELFGIGRLDVAGDDGVWIAEGRLTPEGRSALRAIEESDLTVHLVSPSEDLLADFLSAAGEPFLVTGQYNLTESMVDRAIEKEVILAVDFDPAAVDDFIERLEDLKNRLGRRDLLVMHLTATEGLDEAKRHLYLGLRAKGWCDKEIDNGSWRAPGGIAGGNLSALGAAQGRPSQRR